MRPYSFKLIALVLAASIQFPVGAYAEGDSVTRKKVQTYLDLSAELFQAGDYTGALNELRRAEALYDFAVVRFNIARCLEELNRGAEAVLAYEKYLSGKDTTEGNTTRQKRAKDAVARLEPKVFGGIDIACPTKDATLTIKGILESPAKCPWKNNRIPIGNYEVKFQAQGFEPSVLEIEVTASKTAVVKGFMVPAKKEPEPVVSNDLPPPPSIQDSKALETKSEPDISVPTGISRSRKTAAIIFTGVGAVGLVGTAAFVYLGKNSNNQIQNGGFASGSDIEKKEKDGKASNAIAIVSGIVGIASTTVGIVLFTTGKTQNAAPNIEKPATTLKISPNFSPSGAGVLLSGTLP